MNTAMFILAVSGDFCPETGRWVSNGAVPQTRFFRQGEAMPVIDGLPVTWRFLLAL